MDASGVVYEMLEKYVIARSVSDAAISRYNLSNTNAGTSILPGDCHGP